MMTTATISAIGRCGSTNELEPEDSCGGRRSIVRAPLFWGGISGGANETGVLGAGTGVGCAGYGLSSEILNVGATRGRSGALCRAPHPPQNRESGAFSVPQVGQRIPP